MTATPNPEPRQVSRDRFLLSAKAPTPPAGDAGRGLLEEATERHERLAQAAERAPHGQKLRLLGMTYAACHQRMAAELRHD